MRSVGLRANAAAQLPGAATTRALATKGLILDMHRKDTCGLPPRRTPLAKVCAAERHLRVPSQREHLWHLPCPTGERVLEEADDTGDDARSDELGTPPAPHVAHPHFDDIRRTEIIEAGDVCTVAQWRRSTGHVAGLRERRANEAGQNDDHPLGLNPAEDGAPQSGRGKIVVEPESDVDGNDIVAQAAQGLSEAPGAGKELETKAHFQRALGGGGRKGSRCRKNTCSSIVSDSSPNLISWAPHKLCW